MLAQGNPMMTKASKVMDIFYLDEQERKRLSGKVSNAVLSKVKHAALIKQKSKQQEY